MFLLAGITLLLVFNQKAHKLKMPRDHSWGGVLQRVSVDLGVFDCAV